MKNIGKLVARNYKKLWVRGSDYFPFYSQNNACENQIESNPFMSSLHK